nr:MAG TPA: hypothetical protein [Caudoviricetes sp.]
MSGIDTVTIGYVFFNNYKLLESFKASLMGYLLSIGLNHSK